MKRELMTGCFVAVTLAFSSPVTADFVRGDANIDGRRSVLDAVYVLELVVGSRLVPPCADAADANDDGHLDVLDAVAVLRFLFQDGTLPGGRAPGPDLTCDALGCAAVPTSPAVVMSEIHYNPQSTPDREFVELYNRSGESVDVSGYGFTVGVRFTLPEGTVLGAGERLLVVQNPPRWRNAPVPVFGPYEGTLADSGERVTLADGDCVLESVEYDDRPPWPTGADGQRGTLERIDSGALADESTSWRTSFETRGTAGEENSTTGIPVLPVLRASSITPGRPTSADIVSLRIELALGVDDVVSARFRWQAFQDTATSAQVIELRREPSSDDVFTGVLPAVPSQTLVRGRVEVELAGGDVVLLPPGGEPRPFLSYFVYDFEVLSRLPVLWLFPTASTELVPELSVPFDRYAAAVVVEAGAEVALLFDGAAVHARFRPESNGKKVRFLKGEEYRGDRTLNVLPEGSGASPHGEQLGFLLHHELGVPASRAEWFRVIDYAVASESRHTQNVVVQQVNERFLEMNDLDGDGDLYKVDKLNWQKKTNVETDAQVFIDLLRELRSEEPSERGAAVRRMDLESVLLYSVAGVLIANWDGFHNNIYFYRPLGPPDRAGVWKAIPWDLDQVFGGGHFDMPVTYPLDGRPTEGGSFTVEREPGLFSHPFHRDSALDAAYRRTLGAQVEPGGYFSPESFGPKIDEVEALLLDDLELQEAYLGASRTSRREQITSAYAGIREYVRRRCEYLRGVLK